MVNVGTAFFTLTAGKDMRLRRAAREPMERRALPRGFFRMEIMRNSGHSGAA